VSFLAIHPKRHSGIPTPQEYLIGENQVFGPKILREVERQVQQIRENLRTAKSRQKSYADHRRRELSFEAGDFVYL
jgi:hypothetical protein